MAKKNHKKKKLPLAFYIVFALVALIVFAVIFYKSQPASGISVFPENPKQGDTVLIKVKSQSENITGNFGNEKLFFYKKANSNEWLAYLGIDAVHEPGNYKISVNIPGSQKMEKEIKVQLADFSEAKPALAPKVTNGSTNEKAVNNILKKDNPPISQILSNVTAKAYFAGPFSFPLSKISKTGFSFGKFIAFGKTKIQHLGVDLKAAKETEIFAVNNGKVVATLNLLNYGKTVIIDHGLDIFSLYLHLDNFKVVEGQMVKKNQVIGLSGDTGYVTAPHLHFSMRVDGSRVDPIVFIKATQSADENYFIASLKNSVANFLKFVVK